jgi:hypothetical protein
MRRCAMNASVSRRVDRGHRLLSAGGRGERLCLNQRGGGSLVYMLGVTLALLAVTPFLFDIANTYYARSIGRTGADAGALAAAQALDEALETPVGTWGDWTGSEEAAAADARRAAERDYARLVYGRLAGDDGERLARAWAADLAGRNGAQLVGPSRLVSRGPRCRQLLHYTFCDLRVDTHVERDVRLILQDLYGGGRKAPARTTAEVYYVTSAFTILEIQKEEVSRTCCGRKGRTCTCWNVAYKYRAKARLNTQWDYELIK